jgi:protein farnesyltransferase subunit beta
MSLKQPDGSFLVAHDAEVDVRGTYCLLVVAHILDLLTPELLAGVPAFIASCQTYEGGFASASQPYYVAAEGLSDGDGGSGPQVILGDVRPPLGEAHGGYTFCALASWIMLQPYLDLGSATTAIGTATATTATATVSQTDQSARIDYKRLLRWLVQMQGSEIELGGFRGRTNKLVDGCYSWWVGGCFSLLASQGVGGSGGGGGGGHTHGAASTAAAAHDPTAQTEGEWDDVDGELCLLVHLAESRFL